MPQLLPASFYERECLELAVDLLGKVLRHGPVTLRITEAEAYRFPSDTANHCRSGRTRRNAAMWGPAGHAYVYLCYGLHQLFNVVAEQEGRGAGVLIRSCEVLEGLPHVQARRGGKAGPVLLTGPGKVASALAVDTSHSGHPLYVRGGIELFDAPRPEAFLVGPRVGVDYAEPEHRDAPWRVALPDTKWVSHRASLRPYTGSVQRYLKEQRLRELAQAPRAVVSLRRTKQL